MKINENKQKSRKANKNGGKQTKGISLTAVLKQPNPIKGSLNAYDKNQKYTKQL